MIEDFENALLIFSLIAIPIILLGVVGTIIF